MSEVLQENVLTEASEQPIQCEREGRQEDVLIEAGEQPIQCEREDPQENISTDVNCWSVFTKCFRRTRNTTRVSEV